MYNVNVEKKIIIFSPFGLQFKELGTWIQDWVFGKKFGDNFLKTLNLVWVFGRKLNDSLEKVFLMFVKEAFKYPL